MPIATGGSLQLLLGRLEFPLEGGVLMRPKELGLQVTNGGRAATVAVRAQLEPVRMPS